MALVECELCRVVLNETREGQFIWLQEKGGERKMPIVIGVFEVLAIHRTINEQPPPRPYTHELFGNVLDALGVKIDRVIINDLQDVVIENMRHGTFFGRLILKQDGRTFDVDSRPSDAIALAAQKGAPIFVEESILEEASRDF